MAYTGSSTLKGTFFRPQVACVTGSKWGRGWEEGKKGGGLKRERVRDACYKNLLLFIFAPAGVRNFLIG